MSNFTQSSKIGFIGAGMVGRSLATALSQQGYTIVAVASRTHSSALALAELVAGCRAYPTAGQAAEASDVVLITASDDAILPVASSVSWRHGQGVVHCSGAASLDVLEPAQLQGAIPGAFHPLQTFSSVEDALRSLPGSTFAIEGNVEMRTYLQDMALALGGNPIFLRPEDKPLYHATVVMVGGLLTGLAGAVAELWEHFGIGQAEALRALAPIIRGDTDTLLSVGMPDAIAGPYVRGDVGTITKHLNALRSAAPDILPVYCEMALSGLHFALEKGNVPPERAAQMREMLVQAKGA